MRSINPAGISRVHLVDASPIGVNVRSTVATYSGVLDELRRAYAATPDAQRLGCTAGDFSYNTGRLRCPACDGTGEINLDVQFLPDVDIVCPQCGGHRFAAEADQIRRGKDDGLTLPELLTLTVAQALEHTGDLKKVHTRLRTLVDLGLGYLTLGEATPALSGGEAQRLKLAAEVDRDQCDALFVVDEPTIGLHPLDVQTPPRRPATPCGQRRHRHRHRTRPRCDRGRRPYRRPRPGRRRGRPAASSPPEPPNTSPPTPTA